MKERIKIVQPREFIEILSELDDGTVKAQLDTELPRMIEGVMREGKPGRLTLTVEAKRTGKQVAVIARVATRIPVADTQETVFFADDGGHLHRADPRQMPLRGLDDDEKPLRTVKGESKE